MFNCFPQLFYTGNIGELVDLIKYYNIGVLMKLNNPSYFADNVIILINNEKVYAAFKKNFYPLKHKNTWD